jgi:hypothetical protein
MRRETTSIYQSFERLNLAFVTSSAKEKWWDLGSSFRTSVDAQAGSDQPYRLRVVPAGYGIFLASSSYIQYTR